MSNLGHNTTAVEFPTGLEFTDPRDEWPDRFRRVVELFEAKVDWEHFERPRPRYPMEDKPYTLHTETRALPTPDHDKKYTWHVLWNPWPGSEREAWIMDGRPLRPEETVMGADDPDEDLIANDRDLVRIGPGRVAVCIQLTKAAQLHSRAENWILGNDGVEAQFDHVLDQLESEPITDIERWYDD